MQTLSIIVIKIPKGIKTDLTRNDFVIAKLQIGFMIRLSRGYQRGYVNNRRKSQK